MASIKCPHLLSCDAEDNLAGKQNFRIEFPGFLVVLHRSEDLSPQEKAKQAGTRNIARVPNTNLESYLGLGLVGASGG